MTIVPTGAPASWQAKICYLAAALFTLASGGTNLIYGWSKGGDTATSLVWATVSLAVSAVLAFSWPALIVSLDRKQWARAFMVLLALAVTGTYSISAALGSAMGGRANAEIHEKDATDSRAKAQAAYDTANAELATIKPARPVAELEALIAAPSHKYRRGCRIVVRSGLRDAICPPSPALVAELGRAKRKAELETKLETLRGELGKTHAPKLANSDAVALATYLTGLGIETTPDRINKLLVILAVLVIECGGGLALAVGMALSEAGLRSGRADGASVQGERTPTDQATERPNAGPERPLQIASNIGPEARSPALNERSARPAHERVLSALRARDGVLFGSQVALGAAFGWSKTRMNEILHELQAAGRVRLSISPRGTAVPLVGGAA